MKRNINIVVLGGDSYQYQNKLLTGIETEMRCERVVELLLTTSFDRATIFLGCGHRPHLSASNTLALAMKEYLRTLTRTYGLAEKVSFVIAQTDAWGTINELQVIAKELDFYDAKEVFVITSWHHMLRVLMISKLIGSFKVHPVWAARVPSVKSLFSEFVFLFLTKKDFELRKQGKKLENPFY